jgi:transcriptional regulator GlxA family with amidase domain
MLGAMTATRAVVVLTFPDALLLDAAGPIEAFQQANEIAGGERPLYDVRLASPAGGLVRMSSGVAVDTAALAVARVDTLLVAGGAGARAAARDVRVARRLRHAAAQARRVASVCTGAFALAAAGLLDGRRAVTHWRWCDALARDFPRVQVERDAIYLRDGAVWTSAGITAGIDLALALIEADHGPKLALAVAKTMVVYARRRGGQSQFSALLAAEEAASSTGPRLAKLAAAISERPQEDWTVERLAAESVMSPRSFARRFPALFGTTPAKYVERIRLEAARSALERGGQPIARIAATCGFGSAETLRRSFQRAFRVAPADYREHFGRDHLARHHPGH